MIAPQAILSVTAFFNGAVNELDVVKELAIPKKVDIVLPANTGNQMYRSYSQSHVTQKQESAASAGFTYKTRIIAALQTAGQR